MLRAQSKKEKFLIMHAIFVEDHSKFMLDVHRNEFWQKAKGKQK